MTNAEAILIAAALAMDCFTISLSCGIMQRRMGRQVWAMASMFGTFQTLMAYLGWWMVDCFSSQIHSYDSWIAFLLLLFLGSKMIWDGIHSVESPCFNPSRLHVLFLLALATSIDALAIGGTFVGMQLLTLQSIAWPLFWIGLFSFLLTVVGKFLGVKIGHRLNLPAEQIGGSILIIIGIKVLIQHLIA